MDKKYIYLIIGAIGVFTIGLFLFLRDDDAKNNPSAGPSKPTTSTTSGSFVLPVPKNDLPTYPAWGIRRQVKTPTAEIKSIFLEELSKNTSQPDLPFQGIYFYDTSQNLISLEILQPSLGFSIQPELFQIIDSNEYEIFYCPEKTTTDLGAIFYLRAPTSGALPASAYENAKNYMLKWEPTMLRDLHPLIFPEIIFSTKDLKSRAEFKDGKSRYAEINLENNHKISLNYYIGGGPVIITSSLSCLEKSKDYFFDTEESN